tara:strand:- start:882 stop:1091 length:210 start_codon:yes stop_codon:yes gene_type:complete
MSDKRENLILLEQVLQEIRKISNDIFFIKNELKCIRDIAIPKVILNVPPIIKSDDEWFDDEDVIGWRIF